MCKVYFDNVEQYYAQITHKELCSDGKYQWGDTSVDWQALVALNKECTKQEEPGWIYAGMYAELSRVCVNLVFLFMSRF